MPAASSPVLSTARALPAIADAVKGQIKVLVDSGIRNGLDVVRMLALGADAVLLGRGRVYGPPVRPGWKTRSKTNPAWAMAMPE